MNAIDTKDLLMEMRALAQQAQGGSSATAVNATQGQEGAESLSTDFASLMMKAINAVNDQQRTSKSMQEKMELGEPGMELSEVMLQAQKASLAFQAMTQVRNKLVDAYKDVMSMPV